LQADYGINFGRFLLDHYKVKAVIDISARVFPVPLIGTCVILLERCSDEEERNKNKVAFMYLNLKEERVNIDGILEIIEKASLENEASYSTLQQKNLKDWSCSIIGVNSPPTLYPYPA